MYMNNSLMVSGVDASGATPRTPEILNSLISMTNPFEILKSQRAVSSPHSDSNSSSCSPPSVQHTCSQLIKEGLKHTLQSKRRNNSETSSIETKKEIEEINSNSALGEASSDGLTPEDEERRRRRRERNKIAATKCRLKKREKTVNLVQESEHLETQNHELKYQIQELEKQKRDLFDMLSSHEQVCAKTSTTYDQSSSTSPFIDQYQRSDRFAYTAAFHNSSVDSSYHRNDRFCRSSTVAVTYNYDENVNATSVLMNNFRVSESTDDFSHADSAVYANLNVRTPNYLNRGSPTRICRPSSISINTSGSEYESNTELVDSPSLPPTNFHTFEEESRTYTEGYARGSCIS